MHDRIDLEPYEAAYTQAPTKANKKAVSRAQDEQRRLRLGLTSSQYAKFVQQERAEWAAVQAAIDAWYAAKTAKKTARKAIAKA